MIILDWFGEQPGQTKTEEITSYVVIKRKREIMGIVIRAQHRIEDARRRYQKKMHNYSLEERLIRQSYDCDHKRRDEELKIVNKSRAELIETMKAVQDDFNKEITLAWELKQELEQDIKNAGKKFKVNIRGLPTE